MMECQEVQDKTKAFFDDLLTEDEYQAVCDHFTHCAQCRQYMTSTGSLSFVLWELGFVDVPKDLKSTIKFDIEEKGKMGGLSPAQGHRKLPTTTRNVIVIGVMAGVMIVASLIVFTRNDIGSNIVINPINTVDATDQKLTDFVGVNAKRAQPPLSHDEAEGLYHQLETIARSLEPISRGPTVRKNEVKTITSADSASARPPVEPKSLTVPEAIDPGLSFHWHFPYNQVSEREQFVETVKLLEINPDYNDSNFLVFKATGKQLKILVDGMQFANKVTLDMPVTIDDEQNEIPVSINFIDQGRLETEMPNVPVEKRGETFVSVAQPSLSGNVILDWHVLLIPAQREKLLDTIRQGGARLDYVSDEAVIIAMNGAGIQKLMENIRYLGGVFVDFGNPSWDADSVMRKRAKVMIYIKEK